MLSEDVAAKVCTKSSSFWVASTAPSVLKTRGAQHEGDEYVFYTSLENGEEQRTAIPMGEVAIITLEGQEGV